MFNRSRRPGYGQANIADVLNQAVQAAQIEGTVDVVREEFVIEEVRGCGPILLQLVGSL